MKATGLALVALAVAAGCGTTESTATLPDAGVVTEAGVIDSGRAGPIACDTQADCPSGQKCLFWGGYCGRGRCEAACPELFDASFYLNCDCRTSTWRAQRCTDYAWSHQGATTAGPDGGQRLLQEGEPCTPMGLDGGPND